MKAYTWKRIIGVAVAVMAVAAYAHAADTIGATKGDVNADGKVTSEDVKLVNQIAVGVVVPTEDQTWAADVNSDGKVDLVDAGQLQDWLDGKSTKNGAAVPVAALPLALALAGAALGALSVRRRA